MDFFLPGDDRKDLANRRKWAAVDAKLGTELACHEGVVLGDFDVHDADAEQSTLTISITLELDPALKPGQVREEVALVLGQVAQTIDRELLIEHGRDLERERLGVKATA